MEITPSAWETEHCHLAELREDDHHCITVIFAENENVLHRIGCRELPENIARDVLNKKNLPPGGVPSRERGFLIHEKSSKTALGIVSFYCGYPTQTTIYIGNLFLRPRFQRRGYGSEIIRKLEQLSAQNRYTEARVGVALNNIGALRFWLSMNYDRITKCSRDDEFPILELAKSL